MFLSQGYSFAKLTPYRSANTITSVGSTEYTNLSNCSATDGLTCDRALSPHHGTLYFKDFGDFGIPEGSTINDVRLRITGKTSAAVYPGVSQGRTYTLDCQHNTWIWQAWDLVGNDISTFTFNTPISNGSLVHCFSEENIKSNNFVFHLHWNNPSPWSANIDNFEVAFDYDPPAPPEPFLDLPWNYESKDMSFTEAATAINSYFDHEYPLLSSGLSELDGSGSTVVYSGGPRSSEDYSSHDGYDYGKGGGAQVGYKEPVLAAAAGIAAFTPESQSGGAGNIIKITHGNGYQTWYEHLDYNGLIVNVVGQEVEVEGGQEIGLTGSTGNCYIKDSQGNRVYNTPACAHIHFTVLQDKNNDGNFDDNIPDGMTDPFGWQSTDPDPWQNYSFIQNGFAKTGNASYYLWIKNLDGLDETLPANGGVFSAGDYTVAFNEGAPEEGLSLSMNVQPWVKVSEFLESIGSSIEVLLTNVNGEYVEFINKPMDITVHYDSGEIRRFDLDTVSIYSSNDNGESWIKEPTTIDPINSQATTRVDHLTLFALMGERIDVEPPVSEVVLSGEEGEEKWFSSDVNITLGSVDNEGGLGVKSIWYMVDDGGWQEYLEPLNISDEGRHTIKFYSVDNDENVEDLKSVEFYIDKTPPELEISYSISSSEILFKAKDGSGSAIVSQDNLNSGKKIVVEDRADNTLTLLTRQLSSKVLSWVSLSSIQYNHDPAIVLDKNNLLIIPLHNLRNGKLSSVGQVYSVRDKDLIGVTYNLLTDKTQIYNYNRLNKQVLKETLAGQRLLQLYTDRGSLKYRY